MTAAVEPSVKEDTGARWPGIFRLMWRRPSFGLAVIYLVAIVAVAVFAPWLAPYDPIQQNLGNPLADFSRQHLRLSRAHLQS